MVRISLLAMMALACTAKATEAETGSCESEVVEDTGADDSFSALQTTKSLEKPAVAVAPSLLQTNATIERAVVGTGQIKGTARTLLGILLPTKIHQAWFPQDDVFPSPAVEEKTKNKTQLLEGFQFFSAAPSSEWMILGTVCVAFCILDVLVFQMAAQTFRSHLLVLGAWILLALLFNAGIWQRLGRDKAAMWFTGYLLEWMLSMDNLFVFTLVFQAYKTPANQIHKALFVGIVGAIAMRMVFFMLVSTLLAYQTWIRVPFGCLLIWSGIQAVQEEDDDADLQDTRLIRALKLMLGNRLRDEYDPKVPSLVTWTPGVGFQATLLLLVVACIEFTDVVFALDSVSAKVAQIPDQYIAFSSSVVAMYGLRSMYFIVQDLVDMFDMLKYGLCLILVFIGIELIFSEHIKLSPSAVCIMILAVFLVSIAGSVANKNLKKPTHTGSEENAEDSNGAPPPEAKVPVQVT